MDLHGSLATLRHGFQRSDQLFFDQIVAAVVAADALRQTAAVNPQSKFELVCTDLLEHLFIERMSQNEGIFVRYAWLASEAYRRLKGSDSKSSGAEAIVPRSL